MSRIRTRHLLFSDAILLSVSPFITYALRFEGWNWGEIHLLTAIIYTAVTVPTGLLVFSALGMYSRLWRYASISELHTIFIAATVAAVVCIPLGAWILPAMGITPTRVPYSVLSTNALLSYLIVSAPRFVLRMGGFRALVATMIGSPEPSDADKPPRRALVIGAGEAGHMLVKEIRSNPDLGLIPVGFLDDDRDKHGKRLSNLPVHGPLSSLAKVVARERVDEVIIAMPRVAGDVVRPVVRAALDAGVRARTIPGLFDIVAGKASAGDLREIQIDDLLRRDPITTDVEQVRTLATGRTVLVTGAGGSIGSELARQISALAPAKLVILGHGENPIFHILNELRALHPHLHIVPVIADIRDRRRMYDVMETHRPYAVFHAAAHKHVPLMEDNVIESITNNISGTQNIVHAAAAASVEHFVCISTDKAVRPTSVMGTSKRVAEHIVRQAALQYGRNFVAVRFGNVLGSQGSVVPTFVEQIRKGGPVMVTHPDMRRYFMTIPEAVQLVLQAGALGKGGELFMLDMGEPVKIVDLAADLIRLSGLEPGVDIRIEFSGMRPGEKLYEEMFWGHEQATPTDHPKVLCARDAVEAWEMSLIDDLITATMEGTTDAELRRRLHRIVPDAMWSPEAVPTITPAFALGSDATEVEEDSPLVRSSRETQIDAEVALFTPDRPFKPMPKPPNLAS
ncbi:MAG: polysaccharide biosynthesis protein [Gemmatimonadaceae bacterium]|nr:polysaccharide biosynthesis protein [Gemmatimonadaceae bacterium]